MAAKTGTQDNNLRRAYAATCVISKPGEVEIKMIFVAARSSDEAVGVAMRAMQKQFPEWRIGYPDAIEITPEEIAHLNVDTLKPAMPVGEESAA